MNSQEAIQLLQDIIRMDTENDKEAQVAHHLHDLLSQHGIESQIIEYSPGRANLVATIKRGPGPNLCLTGHMDVVSAGNPEDWTHPPFSGHIEDGILWGRGASDMKSGLAALTVAFIQMAHQPNLKGSLKLIATLGEEVGELGSQQLTDLGYLDDVDALLIGEPCNIGIIYAHKGSLNFSVRSRGLAAHSSMPDLGNNAIHHLTNFMVEMTQSLAQKSSQITNPELGQTFTNVTLISGGSQVNSIPDMAVFQANSRTIPEFDNQAVIDHVQDLIDTYNQKKGYDLSLEVTADQAPVQAGADSNLIKTIQTSVAKFERLAVPNQIQEMAHLLGQDLSHLMTAYQTDGQPLKTLAVSGTTDAAQFIRANPHMEIAVYGPGVPLLNHKIDERLPIQQYLDFIEVYKDIIANYLKLSD